jgi:hypothetical protein
MSKNYDHKVLLGGASFPVIGEGLFLFTGLDGEVTGVNLPSLNFSKFTQEIPSDRWFFEHNFGYLPLVQVYSQGRVITESVTVNVTSTTVTVQTDNGIQIAGYITLMGAGGSFGGDSSTPSPDNDVLSSLIQTLESHERMRGRGYHLPDAGITNDQVADNAAISWSKISKVGANPADLGAQPAGNYATLVNGVVPTSLLPASSIINVYSADSESAMLAISEVGQGDIVLRTDFTPPEVWMLVGSSWRRTDVTVTSVNNQIGRVVLTASDVGALPANDPSITNARVPSGNAGGDLEGSYPNPIIRATPLGRRVLQQLSEGITDTEIALSAGIAWSKISKVGANPADLGAQPAGDYVTAVNGRTGRVVLSASDISALPANDPSVTNSRVPTGNAGGDLAGIYPNPTLSSADLRAIASLGASPDQGILQKTGVTTWRLLSSISSSLISGLRALAFKDTISNDDVATGASIAWDKISKAGATVNDVGLNATSAGLAFVRADLNTQKSLITYGFHYYQVAAPDNPRAGERWAELDSNGVVVDEWVYNGTRWIGTQSLTLFSPQVNISTYPTSSFYGFVGTKYDILIEVISLNYNQASGFAAGVTYCSARFQLTGIQHDQINSSTGSYREIGIVNQASATGCTSLNINRIFTTGPNHYAVGTTVTKVGTATTGIFYSNFGVQYRWVRK